MKKLFLGLLLVSLYSCSTVQHQTKVECDNVVCDTINNYFLKQVCKDTTIEYNFTYTDTIKLKRIDGVFSFRVMRCQNCQGTQFVNVLNSNGKIIQELEVEHNYGAHSTESNIEDISMYLNPYIKIDWKDYGGKVFYLTK
jgi:hypothetical protein